MSQLFSYLFVFIVGVYVGAWLMDQYLANLVQKAKDAMFKEDL